MKIYDSDNGLSMTLTPKQEEEIRHSFKCQKIMDVCGEVIALEDCLDAHGNLDLDEDAYDTASNIARLVRE